MRPLLLSNTVVFRGSRIPLCGEKLVATEGMQPGDRVIIHAGRESLQFSEDGERKLPAGLAMVQAERSESVGSEVTVWVK